ncbi:NUDIX hydrolase [Amycolatopsis anabasis]|uniref:NUDIX hydrolase n=1 Tax=Amycolatopsis anabasis TaxID=1840409 RepID=UPI00131E007D|nr:NUDIX domain-containing protein [Amycolatopsis anabasis]
MNGFVLAAAIVAVLVVLGGLWLVATANRLDRLHVRMDAGWAALDAALARRAVVARTVAAFRGAGAAELRAVAERAEGAPRAEREAEENELTRLLSTVDRTELPPPLADELTDAEHRVVIARRVHNDAVRDTLALRRRRRVRYFKLAGTAPQPEYFEIAEPELEPEDTLPTPRTSARVVLVDRDGRVLLFNGFDPADPAESFWFTTGGGVERGEDVLAAARRELREETGLELPADRLTGPVWRRRVRFSFEGRAYDGDEWFFLAELRGDGEVAVDVSGFNEIERATIREYRWWSADELRETDQTVYPERLGELLPDLLGSPWNGQTRLLD